MNNMTIREQLIDRLGIEFRAYKQELLSRTPEEILESAHSYHVRESVIDALIYDETLPEEMMQALLASDTPLQDIFEEWCEYEGEAEYMAVIRKCIADCADRKLGKEV